MDLCAFALENYDLINVNRTIKRGKGFLFIASKYNAITVHGMSKCIYDILECITVEVKIHNAKNIIFLAFIGLPVAALKSLMKSLQI